MTSLWARFGLARNPFFQEPLVEGDEATALDDFFIGRTADRALCITRLTHDEQTRVVVLGAPGVGKTTLMNRILADLRAPDGMRLAWLVPELAPINLPSATTLPDFCIEVLRHTLDLRRQVFAIARKTGRAGRATAKQATVRARRAIAPGHDVWDVVSRVVEGALTVSPQVFGFGATTQFTPPVAGAAGWVPLTQQALAALAAESGREILLAVNNAENLAGTLVERAQEVLVDARDIFLTPHTHWMFVGTPDFFDRVILPRRQLAGIMQHPVLLPPLGADAVRDLIARRYDALQLPGTVFTPPVSLDTAAALARVFVGDLRELLRALETAVLRRAPLGTRTVSLVEAMQVVSQQQREFLRDRMHGAAWEHLRRVVVGSDTQQFVIQRFREADAVRILAPMTQAAVNAHKRAWIADGLVRFDGRTGASEWLSVTGEALLAMLPDAVASGKTVETLLDGRDREASPMPFTGVKAKAARTRRV